MDQELWMNWVADPKSLLEWGEAFLSFKRCLEALPDNTEDQVTSEMMSAKKRFQRQIKEARTPARTLFPDKEETSSEGFEEVTGLTTPSPFKPVMASLSLSGKASDNDKTFSRLIGRIETGLEAATHSLIENRTIIKAQDKILRGLESRLDTVQDQVGETPLGLSAEFEAPTLNGQVAILAEKVSSLKPASVNLSETQVLTWVNSWWNKTENKKKFKAAEDFSKDCGTFLTSLVSSFQTQATAVQTQANELARLSVRINSMANVSTTSFGSATAPSAFAALQSSLQGTSATNPSGTFQQTLHAPATSVAQLELRIKALDAKLAQMMSGVSTNTIKFGGAGFSGPRDVMPLIQAQMPIAYFGCFVNAAILMEWILGNVGEDTLKNMERMHKLKIPSLAEVHSLKGLEAALPRLLGDVFTFTGKQNMSYYTKVPSVGVWTNGSLGTKEFILGSLSAVVSAVRANIDQRLPHGKELHTMARLCLKSSASFIMAMVSFTEENRKYTRCLTTPKLCNGV